MNDEGRPCYVISVAAEMLGTRTHTLRYYEKVGIIKPFRSPGNIRLYTEEDIALMRRIRHLMNDLGVNIAGVEVILNILDRLVDLQRENRELSQQLEKLKGESP
ncbi:MAG: MerR family transcriptional regulator [Dehalococcoidales bacterium]